MCVCEFVSDIAISSVQLNEFEVCLFGPVYPLRGGFKNKKRDNCLEGLFVFGKACDRGQKRMGINYGATSEVVATCQVGGLVESWNGGMDGMELLRSVHELSTVSYVGACVRAKWTVATWTFAVCRVLCAAR